MAAADHSIFEEGSVNSTTFDFEKQQREATTWATGTLTAKGCTLHSIQGMGWDVEMPDGSWRAANNWRELYELAEKVQRTV